MKKIAAKRMEKMLKPVDPDSARVEAVLATAGAAPRKADEKKGRIVVNLGVVMAKRKISLGELAQKVDITMANLSVLKNDKAKAVRFSTLEAICRVLDCQPGDLLEFVTDEPEGKNS